MENTILRQLTAVLPPDIAEVLRALPPARFAELEELHFRTGCEVTAVFGGRPEVPLTIRKPILCTLATLRFLINAATGYSVYAAGETLRQGFIPLRGGHRLGICGEAVVENGAVTALKHPSSACLRVARQRPGCADGLLTALGEKPEDLLIAGPPGSGKTTLLRDLVRQLSGRLECRVAVVDSRGELAASFEGVPQLDVGRCTDVVSLIPKDRGMELVLRAMNPEWISVDEITAPEDVEAMMRASYCGVRLLATAHAFDAQDLLRRPVYRRLTELSIFETVVILDRKKNFRIKRIRREKGETSWV